MLHTRLFIIMLLKAQRHVFIHKAKRLEVGRSIFGGDDDTKFSLIVYMSTCFGQNVDLHYKFNDDLLFTKRVSVF